MHVCVLGFSFFFTTLYLQTDNCLCCFRKHVAVAPLPFSLSQKGFCQKRNLCCSGRESRSKSATLRRKRRLSLGMCPPAPTRTWQTNTAVTPLTLLPNADLILPVGRVVLIAGTAAAMSIHTALPFWAGGPGCRNSDGRVGGGYGVRVWVFKYNT